MANENNANSPAETNDQQQSKKKPLWRRIMRKFLIGFAIFVVIVVVGLIVWNYIAGKQLENEVAKIRAKGEPLTYADLEARTPKVPEADNAGPIYEQAIEAVTRYDEIVELLLHVTFAVGYDGLQSINFPDDKLIEAKELLLANKSAIALLNEGSKLPTIQYKFDVSLVNFESFNSRKKKTKRVQDLLALQTYYFITANEPTKAVDSIITTVRFSRILNPKLSTLTDLTRLGELNFISSKIQILLNTSNPSDSDLLRLQAELDSTKVPAIRDAYIAERCFTYQLWMPDEKSPIPKQPKANNPFTKQMLIGYLSDMQKMIDASEKPWSELYTAILQIPPTILFGRNLVPGMKSLAVQHGKTIATLSATKISLLIERYRLLNGKLPDSLNELTPKFAKTLPLDPFTGKSMLYRHDEKTYCVYSVGKNLKDDKAKTLNKSKAAHDDWGVRVQLKD